MSQNIPSGICEWRARSGHEIVNEIGVAAIRAKSQQQAQRLIAPGDEISPRPAYLNYATPSTNSIHRQAITVLPNYSQPGLGVIRLRLEISVKAQQYLIQRCRNYLFVVFNGVQVEEGNCPVSHR